jgi:hypothetical protein
MSKVVAIAASLKAVMVVAAGAVMRGDMLPVILISAMFEFGLQMRHNAEHREASYIGRNHALILPGLDTKPGSDEVRPDQVAAETGQQAASDHKPIENMSGIQKFKKSAV